MIQFIFVFSLFFCLFVFFFVRKQTTFLYSAVFTIENLLYVKLSINWYSLGFKKSHLDVTAAPKIVHDCGAKIYYSWVVVLNFFLPCACDKMDKLFYAM